MHYSKRSDIHNLVTYANKYSLLHTLLILSTYRLSVAAKIIPIDIYTVSTKLNIRKFAYVRTYAMKCHREQTAEPRSVNIGKRLHA